MLDNDGYPTEETLEKIKSWPHTDGWEELLEFVKENWYYPEYFNKFTYEKTILYHISTGGWSGNEDILSALKSNHLFWMFCWLSSKRGGHYEFEVKRKV